MPVRTVRTGQTEVSCFDRMKLGFGMGMIVGLSAGVLIGGFSCIRAGLRGRELLSTMAKTTFSYGGSFGTFMAVGTGIRC
ncbi:hypothetical protein ACOME3_000128 [Neoechinorhynchus agilis]